MKRVKFDGLLLNGLSVRTQTSDEMDPQLARIGRLWQHFYTQLDSLSIQPSVSYGIYSNYASDDHGEYDVTVAIREDFLADGKTEITIPAGNYLRFEKQGPCPQTTIGLWQEISNFFLQDKAPERSFICDFEEYPSMESVVIYIGIKEGI